MADKKYPFTFEEFKTIYSQVPRITVDLIIQSEQGILLTLRDINPHKGEWHLPGSTVYFKEPLEETVKRVGREELNVELAVDKFLGYLEYFNEDKAGGFDYPISMVFVCHIKEGSLQVDDNATDVQFFQQLPDNMIDIQKEYVETNFLAQKN